MTTTDGDDEDIEKPKQLRLLRRSFVLLLWPLFIFFVVNSVLTRTLANNMHVASQLQLHLYYSHTVQRQKPQFHVVKHEIISRLLHSPLCDYESHRIELPSYKMMSMHQLVTLMVGKMHQDHVI